MPAPCKPRPTELLQTQEQTATDLEKLTATLVDLHNTLHTPKSAAAFRSHCNKDYTAFHECPRLPEAASLETYINLMSAAWKAMPGIRVTPDNVTAVLDFGGKGATVWVTVRGCDVFDGRTVPRESVSRFKWRLEDGGEGSWRCCEHVSLMGRAEFFL